VKTHAFSGGGATKEEQEAHGADLEVDVPYQYLRFFLESDEELADVSTFACTGTCTCLHMHPTPPRAVCRSASVTAPVAC